MIDNVIFDIVESSDSFIAFGGGDKTYLSTDNGNSWYPHLNVLIADGATSNFVAYYMVDKKIIAYDSKGNLFYLHNNGKAMQAQAIASDGLEHKDISSITLFQNKVFVSTLSGLYYKDVSNLLLKP